MQASQPQTWIDTQDGDGLSLRRAVGSFATGVTVVATTTPAGETRAFTANSFSSVSLDPPLIMVCIGKFSASLAEFQTTETFSVSVLEASQRDLSGSFASRDPAVKIAAAERLVQDRAPYVDKALATFICRRFQVVDAGDHIILLGQIEKYRLSEGDPLGFFRGAYIGIGPDIREIESLNASVVVGGVLGYGGMVLLRRRAGSKSWEIPSIRLARGDKHSVALQKLYAALGIEVTMPVPYSVFQEPDEHDMTLIFSLESKAEFQTGRLANGNETALFSAEDEPWNLVEGEMKQWLLRRYLREMASGAYGVYFDTDEGGSIIPLMGKPFPWQDWDEQASTSRRKPADHYQR